ncbi:MAG: DUF4292 domain-containing protein, partial [Mucilaginibacter polytrichastri]|nr:DUF4292 domain-containing protein [Mucilaginibacter polytrichastri]
DLKPGNQVQINGQAADLMYSIIFGANAKPMTETLTNQAKGQSLNISNDKFMDVSGRVIPANIRIDSKVKEKAIQLILNYTKIDLDQNLQYPFTVSSRYTRAD